VTFWYGSGSGPKDSYQWLFSSVAEKMPTKNKFFSYLLSLLLIEGTYKSVFKDKKSRQCHNILETKVLLTFCFLVDGRILILIQIRIYTNNDGSGSGWNKIGPTVLQRALKLNEIYIFFCHFGLQVFGSGSVEFKSGHGTLIYFKCSVMYRTSVIDIRRGRYVL
jgi:hypothetical protein